MKHGSHFNQEHKHLIPLEILNGAFVFLRRSLCLEGAEISSFACLGIFLARIKSILAAFQFPDHDSIEYSRIKWTPRVEFVAGNRFGCRITAGRRSACPTKAWLNGSKSKAPPMQPELRDWSPGEQESSNSDWRDRNSHRLCRVREASPR